VGGGDWGWDDGMPLRHSNWNTAPDRKWNGKAISGAACAALFQPATNAHGAEWKWSEMPCGINRVGICRAAPPAPPPPPPHPPPPPPPPPPRPPPRPKPPPAPPRPPPRPSPPPPSPSPPVPYPPPPRPVAVREVLYPMAAAGDAPGDAEVRLYIFI